MNKQWWMSRTIWVGALEIICGVATYIAGLPGEASVAAVVAGVATIVLRIITRQPITS